MIIRTSTDVVKQNTLNTCLKLPLTSGAKVRKKKHAPPPPPPPVLTIGKLVSLELTLAAYEITPNARTAARLGGDQ